MLPRIGVEVPMAGDVGAALDQMVLRRRLKNILGPVPPRLPPQVTSGSVKGSIVLGPPQGGSGARQSGEGH